MQLSPIETIYFSPMETIWMKYQILFSLKNIINLWSFELAKRVIKVKKDSS